MSSPITRRTFVRRASAVTAAGLATAHLPATTPTRRDVDEIRIGLIGCGGRGSGAARDAIKSSEGVRLVAMADVFPEKVQAARSNLAKTEFADRITVDDDHCFVGLDAYKQLIHSADVDLVIHATSPGFRPIHLAEAVDAGKHSFIEKPGCVDPIGYRSVLASAERARQNNLAIGTGTQFRRANNYHEAVAAIHDGAIGDILSARARYCSGGIWYRERRDDMSDVAYQINNWYHFVWLCGDQIAEQAVHNIDAINWVMGGPPATAYGSGGQRCRPADSEIYDSTSIDYTYPNGATVAFRCRQHPGKTDVSNRIVGTKGVAEIMPFGTSTIISHGGEKVLKVRYKGNAYVQEHADLIASIRAGEPIVEAEEMVTSSLTAVMGRMAAYTGEVVDWDFVSEKSQLSLMQPELTMASPLASAGAAVPGVTKLV